MLPKNNERKQPAYKVVVNGNDITTEIKDRLINLSVVDNKGFETDTVDIALDDSDGSLDMPPRGAKVQVWIGWAGEGLTDKGVFTIDEVRHTGPADVLSISGKSADMRAGLQRLHEESYDDLSIKDIVEIIAGRHNLQSAVDEQWQSEVIEHIDQQSESDAGFLSRLATEFDAIATVKNERLLFIKSGESKTASGMRLNAITIKRQQGDMHNFAVADREAYTGVVAQWQDNDRAEIDSAEVSGSDNQYMAGDSENVKVLRHIYANERNAKRAARAAWDKIQRGAASFTVTLAEGNADLYPETPVKVEGYKRQIDAADWILVRVTHSISDAGFTTALEMEVKNSAVPD